MREQFSQKSSLVFLCSCAYFMYYEVSEEKLHVKKWELELGKETMH